MAYLDGAVNRRHPCPTILIPPLSILIRPSIAAFRSTPAPRFGLHQRLQLSGPDYQVMAQADEAYRLTADDIGHYKTRNDAGEMVPTGRSRPSATLPGRIVCRAITSSRLRKYRAMPRRVSRAARR